MIGAPDPIWPRSLKKAVYYAAIWAAVVGALALGAWASGVWTHCDGDNCPAHSIWNDNLKLTLLCHSRRAAFPRVRGDARRGKGTQVVTRARKQRRGNAFGFLNTQICHSRRAASRACAGMRGEGREPRSSHRLVSKEEPMHQHHALHDHLGPLPLAPIPHSREALGRG